MYGGRRVGKTQKLLQFLRDNPECKMVTFSHQRVRELNYMYPDLKGRFVSFHHFDSRVEKDFVVDDLDMILNCMFTKLPKIVTFTPNFCSRPERIKATHSKPEVVFEDEVIDE